MAQDLLANGHSLAAIMLAGRWKHTSMPAYYTRNIAVGRGAVVQYHQRDPTRGQIKSNPLGSYGIIPKHTGARFGT